MAKPHNQALNKALVRLNKFIADSGLCSRRKADELIHDGQVMLNGKKVFELGVKVDPTQDRVLVNGKPVAKQSKFVYYMFHKPKNVVTTLEDPLGRPKVGDFIDTTERLFPVGRLDWDTEGLLLMTNDGQFAQDVAHPKKEIPKTYLVKIDDHIDPAKLKKLIDGVSIIGGRASAKAAEKVKLGNSKKYEWIKITISEGKNRQIRRMFEKIGYDVLKLQRISIGGLKLGALKKGEYRALNAEDLDRIFHFKEAHVLGIKPGKHSTKRELRQRRAAKQRADKKLPSDIFD